MLSEQIKSARLTKGLSRAQLAEELSVTPTAVWNWEARGMEPRPEMLAEIAKALGVTEKWLRHVEDAPGEDELSVAQLTERFKRDVAKLWKVHASRLEVNITYKG